MNSPTRSEIADVIQRMLAGELTRTAASEWASTWLSNDAPVRDDVAWDAIKLLGAADLISTDRPYMYNEEDFVAMLKKFKYENHS